MSQMFRGSNVDQPVENWDVSKVTSMQEISLTNESSNKM